MSTRADVCEQLKSVLDSLGPGEAIDVALEEGRAGLDGWGDFWAFCQKEHKKTVKTEFDNDSWSCTVLKKADASSSSSRTCSRSRRNAGNACRGREG